MCLGVLACVCYVSSLCAADEHVFLKCVDDEDDVWLASLISME